MDVTISLIPYEDKIILHNLIQLYRYDSSEFDGHALTKHGLYSYKYLDYQWTEDYRRPFLIEVDGEIAGFALIILDVPREFVKLSQAEKTNVISDFFIMRKIRRRGVGKKVAFTLFEQFKGTWVVRQTESNIPAHSFWKRVIADYCNDGVIEEQKIKGEKWNGPVFVFES